MAYYYKGLPIQCPYTISSNQRVFTVETFNLNIEKLVLPAQRWEMSFSVTGARNEADLFLSQTVDFHSPDTMIMPQLPSVLSDTTFSGGAIAATTAEAGASTVSITPDASGVVPAATFIQFDGFTKVYALTATNTLTNGVGATFNIFPALESKVLAGSVVNFGPSVIYNFYKNSNSISGITYSGGILVSAGTINLVEKKV